MRLRFGTIRLMCACSAAILISAGIVYAANPDTPEAVSPLSDAGSQSRSPELIATDFADSDTDAHEASQWQVSSSSGSFTDPVWDSGTDTVNLTEITVPVTLDNNTKYYWRVRYKDDNDEWSAYSVQSSFTPAKVSITAIGSHEFETAETAILAVIVRDSNDDAILTGSGATAVIDIFSPSQTELVSDDDMTYLSGGNGIFYYGYTTPATEGVYTFVAKITYNDQISYGANTFHVSPSLNTVNTNLNATVSSRASQTSVDTIDTNVDDIETTVTTIDLNVDDIGETVTTIDGNVDDIETALAVVDGNVDDIEDLVTTIDGNVDDIEDLADDTNDRVKNIEDDVDDIKDDLESVKDSITAVEGMVTTASATAGSEHAALFNSLTGTKAMLAELDVELGFSGKDRSVWDELNEAKDQLRAALKKLGVQTANLEQVLELDTAGKQDLKAILNQLSTLKAVADVTGDVLDDGAAQTVNMQKSWFSFGSIIQNFLVVNPTKEKTIVSVKEYLPEEITTRDDILDLGGMNLEFDETERQYFVTKNVPLEPGESLVLRVRMKDVFTIDAEALTKLGEQATALAASLRSTAVSAEAADLQEETEARIIAIIASESDVTLTADEKITAYRANKKSLETIERDVARLEALDTSSGTRIPNYFWLFAGIVAAVALFPKAHQFFTAPRPVRTAGITESDRERQDWGRFLRQFK